MALSKIVARVSICMIVEYPQVVKTVAKKLVAEIAELGTSLGYAICKELYELLPTYMLTGGRNSVKD